MEKVLAGCCRHGRPQKQLLRAIRAALVSSHSGTSSSFCSWEACAALVQEGSAAAAAFLESHQLPSSSSFQCSSASADTLLPVISASISMLQEQSLGPAFPDASSDPSSDAASLPAADFSASLLAYAAAASLLHLLDVNSSEISSIQTSAQLTAADPSAPAAVNGLPGLNDIYVILEGIRASTSLLQESSSCPAARSLAVLYPQLKEVTADAQPLAHSQLLAALEPSCEELLGWHFDLLPIIQQQMSRLGSTGSEEVNSSNSELSSALMASLLSAYVAGLADLLDASAQLGMSQNASVHRIAQHLPAWVQQLLQSITGMAAQALKQVQDALTSDEPLRDTIKKILNLGLPVDEVSCQDDSCMIMLLSDDALIVCSALSSSCPAAQLL